MPFLGSSSLQFLPPHPLRRDRHPTPKRCISLRACGAFPHYHPIISPCFSLINQIHGCQVEFLGDGVDMSCFFGVRWDKEGNAEACGHGKAGGLRTTSAQHTHIRTHVPGFCLSGRVTWFTCVQWAPCFDVRWKPCASDISGEASKHRAQHQAGVVTQHVPQADRGLIGKKVGKWWDDSVVWLMIGTAQIQGAYRVGSLARNNIRSCSRQ